MWLKGFVAIIAILLIAPILIIFPLSFTSVSYFEFPPPGYSTKWYTAFLENGQWQEVFVRSLQIAFFTAIVSLIIGSMAAYAVVRMNFWGKKIFMAILVAPMVIPVIVVGIALYSFFAPMQLTDSIFGLVLSHSILSIPIVFVTVMSSLKGMDQNLELAARGLGSTPIGAFFKITVPMIRPAFFSSALFAFIISFDEPVMSIFIAGPTTKTLPVLMWENMRSQVDPTIAVVSAIMIFLTLLVFVGQELISNRTAKVKDTH